MNKYTVSYTTSSTVDIWATSEAAADAIVQTYPNYYETIQVTDKGAFDYSLGQTLYYFDTVKDTILAGIVTDINYVSAEEVRVFVRFAPSVSSTMFIWPAQTTTLYTDLDDLIAYLGRDLDTPTPPITLTSPNGLNATSITTTSFVLNWLAVTGATGYNIYKDGQILYSNAQNSGVLIQSLSPNTAYSLQVSALNPGGESARSTALVTTTLAQLASVPNGLVSSAITDTSFTVSWNASARAVAYNVYVNSALLESITATTYDFSSLLPETVYQIQISATNTGGESAKSTALPVATNPSIPAVPTNLASSAITDISLTLTWDSVVNADEYNVYQDDVLVDTVTVATVDISGLTADTLYGYKVSSVNISGESAVSAVLNVTTLP